eukprot:scaffold92534_cov69-Phaeocystis_antarctica.AAC.5
MDAIAAFACSTPVDASDGGPITSPAPYTVGAPSQRDAPASSSPSPFVFGYRPIAAMYASHSRRAGGCGLPSTPVSSTIIGLPGAVGVVNDAAEVCSRTVTPDSDRSSRSPFTSDSSSPTLRSDPAASPRTIIVTEQPSLEKIFANSKAMIPAPAMATRRGRKASLAMESESKTLASSNGMAGERVGLDPVATRI